jgi:8-oxo-dGTP pyrophosphatase MutT (NUDIX family)
MQQTELLTLLDLHEADDALELRHLTTIRDFVSRYPADFWQRTNQAGHVTASSWIVSHDRRHALLTHHRKLDRWLQPGGHIEDDIDIREAALREAREESGLQDLTFASDGIFDVDVHLIPENSKDPAHNHFDIRFALLADHTAPLVVSSESRDLKWFRLDSLDQLVQDESILRMVRKSDLLPD